MESVLTIVIKVAVMMIMIMVGYVITKKGMLTERGASEITGVLIRIVTPCLIINSFMGSRDGVEVGELFLSAALAAFSIVISLLISRLSFRKEPPERKKVLQFSVVFSNVGFMGVPLVEGIVGEKGVIYASFAIVVFNIFCWTYGYKLMNREAKLKLRALLFNPGIIGLAIGLPIYFFNLNLPAIISEPVSAISHLNTPLAMMIIGSYIAKVDMKSFISDVNVYKMSVLRLLVSPIIFFGALLLIKPGPDLFITSVIQGATPVAANAVLFAVQFKNDSELASKAVAVSTVISILTLPVFTILAQLVTDFIY